MLSAEKHFLAELSDSPKRACPRLEGRSYNTPAMQ